MFSNFCRRVFTSSGGRLAGLKWEGGAQNGLAVGLMLVAVGGASLIPLVIKWGGGEESPFLFNSGWRLGTGVGCLLVLVTFFRSLVRAEWRVLWAYRVRLVSWPFLCAVLGTLDYGLFALSIRFVDVSVSTVLVETHPVMLVVLLVWMNRRGRRYRGNAGGVFLLLVVCFGGFLFLLAGQTGGFRMVFGGFDSSNFGWYLGAALALVGGLMAALTGFTFKWCEDAGRDMSEVVQSAVSPMEIALCCMAMAVGLANLVSVPLNVSIGLAAGETIGFRSMAVSVLLGGVLVQAVPAVCWRGANLIGDNHGINALLYGVPVLSLGWLWAFGYVGVSRVDYVLGGALVIEAANLLWGKGIGVSFRARSVPLWSAGYKK